MTINQRIEKLIEALNLNPRSFSELIGAKEGTTRNYVGRGSMPGADYIEKIFSSVENINPVWLLSGEGPMFTTQTPPPYKNESMITKTDEPYEIQEYVNGSVKRLEEQDVPLYDFEASAGLTKLFNTRQNVLDYIHIPNMPRCDGAVYITGDSMYPLLKSGDIVMYKIIPDIQTGIVFGNMYLLSAIIGGEEHTLVKYVQKSPEGNEYVRLGSQNQHHDPIDIPRSQIKALAFVKASIRINSMS